MFFLREDFLTELTSLTITLSYLPVSVHLFYLKQSEVATFILVIVLVFMGCHS